MSDTVESTAIEHVEAQELKPLGPMDLLQLALSKDAAIDIIERLATLQENQRKWNAELEFNEAMNEAQHSISNVLPDMTNKETSQKYASFKALNRAIRPVYLKHGFNLSFNAAESSKPDEILVLCDCSHRGGHTKKYLIPMPNDGKGAKGGGVMSKSHATLAAASYGRSCLLKLIFNIAIGEDDPTVTNGDLTQALEAMEKAETPDAMLKLYKEAWKKFEDNAPAIKVIVALKKKLEADFNAND